MIQKQPVTFQVTTSTLSSTGQILKHPREVNEAGTIFSILQLRKPRCTEVVCISQGFTAQMQWNPVSSTGLDFPG